MAKLLGFWGSYTAQPVKESRFGIIPVGVHTVKILDIAGIKASQTCSLDDNGMVTDIHEKVDSDGVPSFDKTFDQDIALIVFQAEDGKVLMHRRASVGWLTPLDKDPKTKLLLATPERIQQYGLKLVQTADGGKYAIKRKNPKKGETEYVGVENKNKVEACQQIMDRLCSACEVETPNDLLGCMLDIKVESEDYNGKTTNDVVAYAKAGVGFKAKTIKVETGAVAQPAIASMTASKDDLPF